MPRLSAFFAVLCSLSSVANAADWPEFRGPNGVGVYNGKPLPMTWGPDKNVVWKQEIAGLGWSSPIAVQGKLYLTTAVPKDNQYSLRAICLSQETGQVEWDKELFVEDTKEIPQPHKKNSHASPTPVSDGKHVWFHFGHMGTACLDLNGQVIWKKSEIAYHPVHGNGASPILVDDLLVFCCDGKEVSFLIGMEQKTGEIRWKTDRKNGANFKFSFATCQVIEHKGQRMIVSPASDYCHGYDPKTGQELWRVKYPMPGWSLICRPVYAHGLVYISTGYVNQHLLAFEPEGTGDITSKIAWSAKRNAPNTPTPIVVGDELYMISDSGFLTVLDAKSGKVHYAERLAGKAYSASPILHDGKLFITSEAGIGQVIAVGKEFKELAKSDMQAKTFATFVPVDGSLFIRTETAMFRVQQK
ncbi:MAG: PQQ-binding-like beta-propeller repeat protein [Fimbriiglobus sp.]